MFKKLNTVIFALVCFMPLMASAVFSDVSLSSKYNVATNYLQQKGIINGYEDGTFKPEININRAELTKILIESNDVAISSATECFPDVKGTDWYVKYVCTAKQMGWVQGYEDGTFKPERHINRAEALKVIAMAEGWNYRDIQVSRFSDVSLSEWYGKLVNYAKNANFLPYDTLFSPATFMTRGDFAEVYYRILYADENNLLVFPGGSSEEIQTGKDYEPNTFESFTLNSPFPSYFVKGEIYKFSGKLTGGSYKNGFLVIFDSSGKALKNYVFDINSAKEFSVDVKFDAFGEFGIGIIPGDNGKTNIANIKVVAFDYLFKTSPNLELPTEFEIDDYAVEFANSKTVLSYTPVQVAETLAFRFDFTQKGNLVSYYTRQYGEDFELTYSDFKDFAEGRVEVNAYATVLGNSVAGEWVEVDEISFSAVNHYFSEISKKVSDVSIPVFFEKGKTLQMKAVSHDILDPKLFVILPTGFVEEVAFGSDDIGSGEQFTFSYTPLVAKPYILEVNNVNGLAVINTTIYPKGTIPLIPDYFDLNDDKLQPGTYIDEVSEKNKLLNLINLERKNHGLVEVKIDSKLSSLAESHNLDMLAKSYFGHINLAGESPNDRRLDFGIITPVGENIAKVFSVVHGHESIMRSAIHRQNVLNPHWTKVGLSIKRNSAGYYYLVEEFSYTRSSVENYFEKQLSLLNPNLIIESGLNDYTEYWTENMIENDFFATTYEGESIFDAVDSGNYASLKSLIVKGAKIDSLIAEIDKSTDIKNTVWNKFGFGLNFDQDGAIIISLMWGN